MPKKTEIIEEVKPLKKADDKKKPNGILKKHSKVKLDASGSDLADDKTGASDNGPKSKWNRLQKEKLNQGSSNLIGGKLINAVFK